MELPDFDLVTEPLLLVVGSEGKGLSAIAISPAKVVKFKGALPHISHLFMNGAEAEAIAGSRPEKAEDWPGLLRAQGLAGGTVTSGSGPTVAFGPEGMALIEPVPLDEIADDWLNLRRLELTVYADNSAAIALYESFGFTVEGRMANYAFRGGTYVEALAMARRMVASVGARRSRCCERDQRA